MDTVFLDEDLYFSVSTQPFIYMTCPPFLIRSLSPIYKHDINLFRLCA